MIGGALGSKYEQQCLDVEAKIKRTLDYLEFYSVLAVQPINYNKTELMWPTRTVGGPKFDVHVGAQKIAWVKSYGYLAYQISGKLGWGVMLHQIKRKIRQRVVRQKSCRIGGCTSKDLKKLLFNAWILPPFAWAMAIFSLFTDRQEDDLGHFYVTCLKRAIGVSHWSVRFFFLPRLQSKTTATVSSIRVRDESSTAYV